MGRYQLVKLIAMGGMAEIYLARARGLGAFEKLVVLKRILPSLAAREDFVAMFLDEARLAATIQHPNVAQVYDIGLEQGSLFYAMEHVHGQDVRTIQKALARARGELALEQALAIVIGAAAGLHAAHEKRGADGQPLGIVHRDVSPSNLLVSYDGAVKLVDFGIAKAASRQTETRTGTLKGKVSYMSPEQCKGEPLDRRSDVFSLGVVLYELTTGHKPFPGATDYAVVSQIVNGEPLPPSNVKPHVPPELAAIIMKALAREAGDRFATAEELQLALEAFVRARRLVVSPVSLGSYLRKLFAARLEEAAADGAAQGAAAPGEIVIDAGVPDEVAGVEPEVVHTAMFDVAAASFRGITPPERARRPGTRRRRWVMAGLAAGVAAGWIAVAALALRAPGDAAATPESRPAAHVESLPAVVVPVSVAAPSPAPVSPAARPARAPGGSAKTVSTGKPAPRKPARAPRPEAPAPAWDLDSPLPP